MALDSDGLLDHLLFKVALSAEQGLDIQGLSHAVVQFYARRPVERVEEDEEDTATEHDILFSLKPPDSGATDGSQASDPQHIEKLWTWLVDHPDVEVRANKTKAKSVNDSVDEAPQLDEHPLASVYRAHTDERLFATENRIWHALTDHGVDYRRIPKLEFQCLSVIAAAGPGGVLQPDVTRLTGQDKRSVPKRTDSLAQKGLITKELCVGLGIKTSILIFKKYAKQGDSQTLFEIGGRSGHTPKNGIRRMIRYDEWFAEIMGHLKKHDNIMAVEDLRKEMGIHGKKWETRSLHRCMRRLGKSGLLKRMKRRTAPIDMDLDELEDSDVDSESDGDIEEDADADVDFDADPDQDAGGEHEDEKHSSKLAKAPRRRNKKTLKVRWTRCVKLMRDPTERDKAAFTSHAAAERAGDDGADHEDAPKVEHEAVPENTVAVDPAHKKSQSRQRIPPQWHPSIHHTQLIFNLINSCGTNGISTMDLTDRAMGHLWRRPLDELLGRLTDVWQVSQPPHLRHLSVVRDTAFLARASHYQFRSFSNYKKLVESGEATWSAIQVRASEIDNEVSGLDEWGFPSIKPTAMTDSDGVGNMSHCKLTIVKPHYRRTYDSARRSQVYSAPTVTPKVKQSARANLSPSKGQPTGSVRGCAKADAVAPDSDTEDRLGDEETPQPKAASGRRRIATPNHNRKQVDSPSTDVAKSTGKVLFKMNPKRVEAELKEWRIRTKKLAESLARAEWGHSPDTQDNHNNSDQGPPKKRRRTRASLDENAHGAAVMETSTDQYEHQGSQDASCMGVSVASARPDNEEALSQVFKERAAELEAEILALSMPRAYINPPGSGQVKMSTTMPTGRPSRYLIAVIKSPRLHDFAWFDREAEWAPTVSHKPRKNSRMLHVQSIEPSLEPTTPQPESDVGLTSLHNSSPLAEVSSARTPGPKPDFFIKGGRKRRSRASLMEHVVKRQATIGSFGQPTPSPLTVNDIPTRKSQGRKLNNRTRQTTPPAQSSAPVTVNSLNSTADLIAPTAAETLVDDHLKNRDASSEHREELPCTPLSGSSERFDANDKVVTRQEAIKTNPVAHEADAEKLPVTAPSTQASTPDPHVVFQRPVERDCLPADPIRQEVEKDFQHAGKSTDMPCYEILSFDQVQEDMAQTPNPRGKVGVPRSGGITKHQRAEIALEIVRGNGGIFGGDKELHLPFIAEWEKHHTQRPDRHTLGRVVNALVLDGRLKQFAFTFEAGNGRVIKKHVVMEPEIDPESPPVKALLQNMIRAYPSLYIPGDFGVTQDPDVEHTTDRRLGERSKKNLQLTVKDHFPEDDTGFISRIHPPTRAMTVKLGMTEAKLERDIFVRKRKREQEERRQERYLRAAVEEEIEDAQNALQTEFRLDSYNHEPERAKIDRGRSGRSRLAQLQRWGASDQTPQKKALGLLGAANRQQTAFGDKLPRSAFTNRDSGSRVRRAVPTPRFVPPGGFHTTLSLGAQSGSGSKIIEVYTMTTPYQRFYPESGTFSTDPLVVAAASKPVWIGTSTQAGPAREQLPMSLADIFREADSNEPNSTGFAAMSEHSLGSENNQISAINYPLNSLITEPPQRRGRNDETSPFSASPYFHIPGRIGKPNRKMGGLEAWQRLSRSSPANKTPLTRIAVPRASRSGIFVMTEAEEQKLLMAVVVVKSLVGGLELQANWGFVHQIFHWKFDQNYCRNRWDKMKNRCAGTADKLQAKFQELYIEAYERGEVPELDYVEPEKYDWAGVVEWAQAHLDTGRIVANELPDLIQDRKLMNNSYDVQEPEELYGIAKEDYWMPLVTHLRREELANGWTHSAIMKKHAPEAQASEPDSLMLAKSWVRANVLTPDAQFNSIAAHSKLILLGEDALPKALDQLLGAKIIRIENKGRAIPGRNYDISDTVLSTFKRSWDANHLRLAASHKDTMDLAFSANGKLQIAYDAPDYAWLAMANLVANGRAKVVPLLPEINNEFGTPWPRLTKWGFTEGNYKTVQMDKERLHFGLELHPTETYIYGNPTNRIQTPLTLQVEGEVGARLPLWTDINGTMIQSVWDMMLMATLHMLAFRPGLTSEVMAGMYKGKLWEWEIDLFLRWAEEAGLARQVGEEAGKGWTTAEWWWLAFAEDQQQQQQAEQ